MIPGRDAGVQAGYAVTVPLSVGAGRSVRGDGRLFLSFHIDRMPHPPRARRSRRVFGRGTAGAQPVSTTLWEAHGDGACRLCLERRNERAR
ncbi:hypothetical protein B1729_16385 [Microbacterium sp. B35-04]|nr:hypothetical protein B1729_16385 [Microbacterium sp. B35-04]KAF2419945.1 hypothetical protein B2K11_03200 [Microbacterium sp. B35-30]